jgi:hypothetical protein
MTAGELIEMLRQYDPEMPVLMHRGSYLEEIENVEPLATDNGFKLVLS